MSKRPAADDGGGSAVKKMRRVADAASSESEDDAYPGSDIGRGGLTPACADVLNKLCDHKHAKPFLAPINEEKYGIEKSSAIVIKYMDLSIVKAKYYGGKYSSIDQFVGDIRSIFKNMMKLTAGMNDSDLRKRAKKMQKFSEKCIKVEIFGEEGSEDEEDDSPYDSKRGARSSGLPAIPMPTLRPRATLRSNGDGDQWVQCDECEKWRRIPSGAILPAGTWTCRSNIWDHTQASCTAPAPAYDDTDSETPMALSRAKREAKGDAAANSPMNGSTSGDYSHIPPVPVTGDEIENPYVGVTRTVFFQRLDTIWDGLGLDVTKRKPMLNHQELDFYAFYGEVVAFGGYDEMIKEENAKSSWINVYKQLFKTTSSGGYGVASPPFLMKRSYEKFLVPYERKYFNSAGVDAIDFIPGNSNYPRNIFNQRGHSSACSICSSSATNPADVVVCSCRKYVICNPCFKSVKENTPSASAPHCSKQSWLCQMCLPLQQNVNWSQFVLCPLCSKAVPPSDADIPNEFKPMVCSSCEGSFHSQCLMLSNPSEADTATVMCMRCRIFPQTKATTVAKNSDIVLNNTREIIILGQL